MIIDGKDHTTMSLDDLQRAAHVLVRHAHWVRVKRYADDLETETASAWAEYRDNGGRHEPDLHDLINDYIDGTCVYNLDIACTLLASNNDTYAVDEGLVDPSSPDADMVRAHYALVQDVTEELDRRGALSEPEPASEATEGDDDVLRASPSPPVSRADCDLTYVLRAAQSLRALPLRALGRRNGDRWRVPRPCYVRARPPLPTLIPLNSH